MKEKIDYTYPIELVVQRTDTLKGEVESNLGSEIAWAQFVLTENCSRRCIMCDYWQTQSQNEINTNEIKDILLQLRGLGTQYVILLGGEVLLRRDLLDIVHHSVSLGIIPELVTSGFDNPDKIEDFVKAGLRSYTFSIDGATPESHNSIRGVPKLWEKLVKGVEVLNTLSKDFPDIRIKTQTVAMKPNLFELHKIIELVGSLGINGVSIMPVKGVPVLVPSRAEVEKYNVEIAPKVAEACERNGFRVSRLTIYPFGESETEIKKGQMGINNLGSNNVPCVIPWVHALINPDGSVYACCSMYSRCLGNVREKRLSEIWQDEPYQELRKKMRNLQLPECLRCMERIDYESVSGDIFVGSK